MPDTHEIPTLLVYMFGDGAEQARRMTHERLLRLLRSRTGRFSPRTGSNLSRSSRRSQGWTCSLAQNA